MHKKHLEMILKTNKVTGKATTIKRERKRSSQQNLLVC